MSPHHPWRPANVVSMDGRKCCCRRCSFLALRQPATPPLRHSGLDPESSSYPVMDPGSKSPRGLGDVRDDVCSVLPAKVLHVIPGLTRNPVHKELTLSRYRSIALQTLSTEFPARLKESYKNSKHSHRGTPSLFLFKNPLDAVVTRDADQQTFDEQNKT